MAYKKTILAFICLSLAACQQDSGQERLDNYLKRLSRALKTDIPAATEVITPAYPERRQRLLLNTESNSDISLLDFLKLDHCKLGQVIAEKNSALGKVASASQQLFYDLAFLQHTPACLRYLEDKQLTRLQLKLTQAYGNKVQHISKQLWLAVLGDSEYNRLWQIPAQIGDYPQGSDTELQASLVQLYQFAQQIKQGHYAIEPAQQQAVENHLANLRFNEGGHFLKSLLQLEHALKRANSMLASRIERPLCYPGHHNRQAEILQNVVNLFFIQDIQVWAAQLNQRRHQFYTQARQLEKALYQAEATTFNLWQQQRDSIIEQAFTRLLEHTSLIQDLYEQCQLSVGKAKP